MSNALHLPSRPAPAPAAALTPQRLNSESLLGGCREVQIEHAGQVYRLRVTALGKLILTK